MNNGYDEEVATEEEDDFNSVFVITRKNLQPDWIVAYDVEFTPTHVTFVDHIGQVQEAYLATDVIQLIRSEG